MQQHVSLAHFVECTLEGINEICGEFANETYRVSQQERQIVDNNLANGGVKRGKQFVFGKHFALCQQVHDGAFAHIRVAHERHTDHSSTVLSLGNLLLINLHEALFE